MSYRSLQACVADLEASKRLVRIDALVDPYLEVAEIQRRVYQAGGPAVLYTNVRGCAFPLVSNLFGAIERVRYMFRDTLDDVRKLVELKIDPGQFARRPWRYLGAARAAWHALPRRVRTGPVLEHETKLSALPQIVCWPQDGGPFITLPQVYTEDVNQPGWKHSNLGMYRVQLAGNQYRADQEAGLHYQIHRGIGVHHAAAIARGEKLKVSVFVGGPPAMTLAAMMPLPEGLPEIAFAGALGGRRIRLIERQIPLSLWVRANPVRRSPHPRSPRGRGAELAPIHADADFCITGYVDPERLLPEGPFGDHLGYYSLAHDFPVLVVERVYHRAGAIWPFTVVGRPPQEDTAFGQFVHELTGPVIPTVVPGVRAVHAVDAAGVHPLLLAIGSERYVPYAERRRPQELLTQANAILGQGQMSLAKYLLMIAHEDCPALDIHDIAAFLRHLLERVDWTRDLHFQTRTTIDTLDYSGDELNAGSKLVIAAVGAAKRELPRELSGELRLPEGVREPRLALPGVLLVAGPPFAAQAQGASAVEGRAPSPVASALHGRAPSPVVADRPSAAKARGEDAAIRAFCEHFGEQDAINRYPLVVVADDSEFAARSLNNFLWTTFTRSNPAADVHGIASFIEQKHWGCRGSLVIDARRKPQHAPPLVEDAEITRRVDALAVRGGPLHGII
ncbi:MAG TPA: UbiD family decarboxylase [Pirellulales bacterium]|nr:UbiD family decarboxylase [Pirellulales bacterium]